MKTPRPLPVKSVHVRHTESGKWAADVTFGIPDDSAHDDPTITITSGEGMESPPKAGDILMVRPPEIIGHAYVQAVQDGADEHIVLIQQRDEARGQANDMREKWLAKGLCCEHLGAELHEAINQRDEARGQRDRLAEALQKVVTAWDLAEWLDENDFESFRATLQSLTTNQP